MKTLAEVLAEKLIPAREIAPDLFQVFYLHGDLELLEASLLFSNLEDYRLDGTGSGPSLFLRKK